MPAPGLSEMPPESKVMPLPTNTVGAALAVFAALVFEDDEARRLGRALATERNEFILSAAICLRSKTCALKPYSLASCLAILPKCVGVA